MANANAEFGILLMRNSSLMAQSDVFDHPDHPFTQWMREFEKATFGIVKTIGHQTAALNAWNAAVTACSSIDALASLAPAAVEGEPVAWHESETPPNCPSIKGDEPVRLEWRNAQGLRCTAWRSAQEIGTAFDTAAQVAALTAQCEADARDAKLWRALLGCKRIRILGTASFGDGNINGLGHYRHFGAEFWTRYGEEVKDAFDGAQVITEFATEAAAIAAGNGEGV